MILAVLEKRTDATFVNHDVYVSTVGGVKLTEPAADLAIALAVLSSLTDKPLDADIIAFGEISLAGEIRPVRAREQRRNEAKRLGFTKIMDSGLGAIADASRVVLVRPS